MAADDDSASSSDAENVGVVSGAAPVGGQGIGRVGRLLWISREVLGINVSVWFESDGRVRRNGIGQAKRDSSDAVSGAPSTRAHSISSKCFEFSHDFTERRRRSKAGVPAPRMEDGGQ